jgi:hypothetical protein
MTVVSPEGVREPTAWAYSILRDIQPASATIIAIQNTIMATPSGILQNPVGWMSRNGEHRKGEPEIQARQSPNKSPPWRESGQLIGKIRQSVCTWPGLGLVT